MEMPISVPSPYRRKDRPSQHEVDHDDAGSSEGPGRSRAAVNAEADDVGDVAEQER